MKSGFTLSPRQQAVIDRIRDKWTAVATDDRPTDKPRAEAAIKQMYRLLGRPEPRQIIWCGSPLGAVIGEMLAKEKRGYIDDGRIMRALNDVIFSWRWPKVNTPELLREIDRHLIHQVGRAYANAIRPLEQLVQMEHVSVSDEEIWQTVYKQVRSAAGISGSDSHRFLYQQHVTQRINAGQLASFRGQYDADLMAYYDYFLQMPEFETSVTPVLPFMDLAESASWVFAGGDTCWVAERHTEMHRDVAGRLHHEHGPALAYPDGLSIYAWHGVTVPAYVIEHPEWITLFSIERMFNVEVRRVMIERYGEDRFLIDTSVLVQADDAGQLYRRLADWRQGREEHLMVRVENSTLEADGTRKAYMLRVPPDMQTAQQAVAWTFGLEPEEYRPRVET